MMITTAALSALAAFTSADGATIIAALGAAAVAAAIAVWGYSRQRRADRRAERATLYARAIAAVEDYLEGPYRIRRRDNSPESRFAITTAISDAKTAISLHEALLEMHAPATVTTAYTTFVNAATSEAGPQMTAAWNLPAPTDDTQIPLGKPYERTRSDYARAGLVRAMKVDLGSLD